MNTEDFREFLQHWDWSRAFNARTLARAEDYFLLGHVVALEHIQDAGQDVLLALVEGNRAQPYACRIAVLHEPRGSRLQSVCTCPMASNCKHVAAALMEAEDSPQEAWLGDAADGAPGPGGPLFDAAAPWAPTALIKPDPAGMAAWTHWYQHLDPAARPPGEVAEAERRFGLLLRTEERRLLVRPAWLRPSKARSQTAAGTWVDPQPLRLMHSGPTPMPAAGWPPGVATALAALMQGDTRMVGSQPWWTVEATHQEDALLDLVDGYPLFFERGSAPLALGAPLPLRWRWTDEPDGSQQLTACVTEGQEEALLLHGTARAWYLLRRARRFGPVDAPAAALRALARAMPPPVQAEQVVALRELLAQDGARLALPSPAQRPPAETLDVAPNAVLLLGTFKAGINHGALASLPGFARLQFDYGGHRVAADARGSVVRRWDGSRLLDIRRALQSEQRAANRLQKMGFETVGWRVYLQGEKLKASDWLLKPTQTRPSLPAQDWAPHVARLRAEGFHIEYDADFPHEQEVSVDAWHATLKPAGHAWFDVTLGIDVGGERVNLLPLLRQMISDPAFPLLPGAGEKKNASWRLKLNGGRYVELPLVRLRALVEPLLEWLEGGLSGTARVHRTQAAALEVTGLAWHGDAALREQITRMRGQRPASRPPRTLQATLRPYQIDGLTWLDFLAEAGLGGILADDMGLGKTVQVLAHVLAMQERGELADPVLVVCPTSLVGNWQAEAGRFAPTLRVLLLHGSDRAERYDTIAQHDLVITTYPLLPRDHEKLQQARFSLLVLDEAQAIKNAASQAARVVRQIPTGRRLALTGTPLENHLGELWAEFDAVEPGLLGSQRQFNRFYRTPIEKHGNSERQQRLNRRVGALLLRRRKNDVLADLPPKTEMVHTIELTGAQRNLYETLRLAQHRRVQEAVAERGLAGAGIIVLDALLKLRQACCDPRLVKLANARKVKTSVKLQALLELLDALLADGRRVLLFSQFTEMLALIEAALDQRGLAWQTLSGQTPARQRSALVRRFQEGATPLFLISLKAGGVGLNLTAADTVIHYDPWWNPAVEAQATDRAHRIGQDKPVFVYRLICKDTIEEKIQQLQARKAELAQAVLEGGGASQRLRFDAGDLEALFGSSGTTPGASSPG